MQSRGGIGTLFTGQAEVQSLCTAAADLDSIKRTLEGFLRPSTSVVYLQADVCREDLLVEIEATGESADH
jgi:hypothetical protein